MRKKAGAKGWPRGRVGDKPPRDTPTWIAKKAYNKPIDEEKI
jgi:hypothetical protein